MKAVFDDPQFSFQMLRILGSAGVGQAEVGECLSTAYRIEEGDFDSWHKEWLKTAQRVHKTADDCLAKGYEVSAREAYMQAGNYYRAAEFYLHGNPEDPRIKGALRGQYRLFQPGGGAHEHPPGEAGHPLQGHHPARYLL